MYTCDSGISKMMLNVSVINSKLSSGFIDITDLLTIYAYMHTGMVSSDWALILFTVRIKLRYVSKIYVLCIMWRLVPVQFGEIVPYPYFPIGTSGLWVRLSYGFVCSCLCVLKSFHYIEFHRIHTLCTPVYSCVQWAYYSASSVIQTSIIHILLNWPKLVIYHEFHYNLTRWRPSCKVACSADDLWWSIHFCYS